MIQQVRCLGGCPDQCLSVRRVAGLETLAIVRPLGTHLYSWPHLDTSCDAKMLHEKPNHCKIALG